MAIGPILSTKEESTPLPTPKSMLIDLDLNVRKKIVIQPRYKEYVENLKQQRLTRRRNPLSRFATLDKDTQVVTTAAAASSQLTSTPINQSSSVKECNPVSNPAIKSRTKLQQQPNETVSNPNLSTVKPVGPIPLPKRSKAKVLEGRIEKLNKVPDARSASPLRTPNTTVVSVPPREPPYYHAYKNCPCTRGGRPECPRCRMLKLADRFCTIVDLRCQKLGIPLSA